MCKSRYRSSEVGGVYPASKAGGGWDRPIVNVRIGKKISPGAGENCDVSRVEEQVRFGYSGAEATKVPVHSSSIATNPLDRSVILFLRRPTDTSTGR